MATSYTKTNWQDAPSTATPITATQLNRMEKGIGDCSGQGNANELAIAENSEAIQAIKTGKQDKFASVSHPDPNGNVSWLTIDTPTLNIYNSNHKSAFAMIDDKVELTNVSGLAKLNVNQNNIKCSKFGEAIPVLGVATPVTAADISKNITESDLPYQAANKQYVEDNFQSKLVSGTNIKTINNQSILGSGNINISGGGGTIFIDSALSETSENPVQNKVITANLNNKQNKFATVTKDGSTQTVKIDDTLAITTNPNLVADQIISTKALFLAGSSTAGVRLDKTVLRNSADFDATQGYLRVRDNPLADDFAVNKKYVNDIKTELLDAITHPYTYDETTKELTLIL